jgi:hypothetical protein
MQDHKSQVRELSDAELDAVAAGNGHAGRGAAGQQGLGIARGRTDLPVDDLENPAYEVLND